MVQSTNPKHCFIYNSPLRAVSRLVKYGFDRVELKHLVDANPAGFSVAAGPLLAELKRLPDPSDAERVRYQLTIQRMGVAK